MDSLVCNISTYVRPVIQYKLVQLIYLFIYIYRLIYKPKRFASSKRVNNYDQKQK